MILSKIAVKERERREPSFSHAVNFVDDRGAGQYDKFPGRGYQKFGVPKNAFPGARYKKEKVQSQ